MIVRKGNGKKLLELNEKELIIYGLFKEKHINRNDILGSYIVNENMLVILSKNYKYFYKNITNAKSNDRDGILAIINELNKEKLIFYTDFYDYNFTSNAIIILCIYSNFLISIDYSNIRNIFLVIILFTLYIVLLNIVHLKTKKWLYSIEDREFQKIDKNSSILSRVKIEEIEKIKRHKSSEIVSFIKGNNKIKMPKHYLITYPVEYKQALKEIELQ